MATKEHKEHRGEWMNLEIRKPGKEKLVPDFLSSRFNTRRFPHWVDLSVRVCADLWPKFCMSDFGETPALPTRVIFSGG